MSERTDIKTVWRIEAPARLHFGFLDLNGGLGRKFGSIGVALDAPCVDLSAHTADALTVIGSEPSRIERYVKAAAAHLGVPAAGHFELTSAIPAHAGFGSGTQLALATAALLARLNGLGFDVVAAAHALDRGNRSGLGLAAFQTGGLVLDGARGPENGPPPVIARLAFPMEWRMILVLDDAVEGVHGQAETTAFATLPPFPEREAADLCRLAVMKILPGVATGDIAAFGNGITELQQRIGDHFAPAQGGRFTSKRVAAAIAALEALGAAGVGQSSWGPTGYAIVRSEEEARQHIRALARQPGVCEGLRFIVARGRNHGASISVARSDSLCRKEGVPVP